MSVSLRPKVFILSGLMLVPVAICWGIAFSLARSEEAAFASGLETTGVVVEVQEDRVRFNGRDSEDVTEVRVRYSPEGAVAPVDATVTVWSAAGLEANSAVALRYLPAEPQKVLLRAAFRNRSVGVVFLTIFGACWLVGDLALTLMLLWVTRRPRRGT